ncbi:glycosyltransferase family 2 protein [Nitrospirillum sp. BR 11828]|uniref:glycosyltransferase family 2 protein n=1 Tax=Nitrospirillum sp. BR 11828 TaxID=3104325 RepID=UPI002ACA0055|nr:glycosyltransferase family 2 protein [Nitrospirillum sp. BR 11828]MDZ5650609.1 glycosyltransferase family 2 protein [Nitrospirillum sp. BR 11828]
MTTKILLFVPMYNCAPQIPRVLAQLSDASISRHFDGLICVDNRSTDNTLEVARAALANVAVPHRALLHNDDNYGLGGSHKVAIQWALDHGYTHFVVLHGDDQGHVGDLVPHIESGAYNQVDCLLGARFMAGSRLQGYSLLRTAANITFNLIFSAVAGQRLYDLGSGLNMYRTDVFSDGFHLKFADDLTFNYYLLLGSCQRNLTQRFFPLAWREDDQISNAKLFRQGRRMLAMLYQRALSPTAFLLGEHRAVARAAYPSTVIERWNKGPVQGNASAAL